MRKIIILLLFSFPLIFVHCQNEPECCCTNVETSVWISYINNQDIDLLNPDNSESYKFIDVYYEKDNGVNTIVKYTIVKSDFYDKYFIKFNFESENVHYITFDNSDADTIYGVIKDVPCGVVLDGIIYNGLKMYIQDTTGVYKIVK